MVRAAAVLRCPADVLCPRDPADDPDPAHDDACSTTTVIKDLLGVTTLASAEQHAAVASLSPDSTGSLTDIAWNGYLTAAETIATAGHGERHQQGQVHHLRPTRHDDLSDDTIKTFGRKAFRRPLTDAEVTSFMRFNSLTPTGTPAAGRRGDPDAFLASPSFIMFPELAQTKQGSTFKLNSYEVATRLSFLFWNSVSGRHAEHRGRRQPARAPRTQIADAGDADARRARKAAAIADDLPPAPTGDIPNGSHWAQQQRRTTPPSTRPSRPRPTRRDGGDGLVLPGRRGQRRDVQGPLPEQRRASSRRTPPRSTA